MIDRSSHPADRRFTLLVNPTAGRGHGRRRAHRVAQRLLHAGSDVEVVPAQTAPAMADCAARAVEHAQRSRAAGRDHVVVVVGGDGTVHVVVQAVASSGVPLGVVPAGSGDDAARAWGLPRRDTDAAADILLSGTPVAMDLGLASAGDGSQHWFATVLAAGFDARVSERAHGMPQVPAAIRYLAALTAELRAFEPLHYRLTLDGVEVERDAILVAVGNTSHFGGGMMICPDADATDGLLDILILDPIPRGEFIRVFPRVYRGTHLGHPAVEVIRAGEVVIEKADVVAYADGERLGALPQRVAVVPAGLAVLGATPRTHPSPR